MIRVIIVDDHPVVRRGLQQIIAAKQDMQVEFDCFLVCDMLT
jgi:DNA-binding NarL/FixJ family response regulator